MFKIGQSAAIDERWASINIDDRLSKYIISDKGRIKNIRSGRILRHKINACGYCVIMISDSGRKAYCFIHRLVCESFMPMHYTFRNQVNHINGNKLDNSLENLEWCSGSENLKHAYRIGLMCQKGENNNSNKYPETLIISICELLEGGISYDAICDMLNVPYFLVYSILAKLRWRHIADKYDFKTPEPKTIERPLFSKEDKPMIKELLLKGKSPKYICKLLSVDYNKKSYDALWKMKNRL